MIIEEELKIEIDRGKGIAVSIQDHARYTIILPDFSDYQEADLKWLINIAYQLGKERKKEQLREFIGITS